MRYFFKIWLILTLSALAILAIQLEAIGSGYGILTVLTSFAIISALYFLSLVPLVGFLIFLGAVIEVSKFVFILTPTISLLILIAIGFIASLLTFFIFVFIAMEKVKYRLIESVSEEAS